jgi:MOSC domain-containing protein YiiM
MKLISVNVGLPRQVIWQGKTVTTGIFKEPVSGPIMLRTLNLEGDRQGDLTVHGGAHKAVYAYPVEHYEYWRGELPDMELPWGMFGENFTVEGLLEQEVNIGDRFRIGAAEVVVTQPRLPCYKLGLKFGRPDMVKRFLVSRRTGFYFAVLKEGQVEAGDTVELLSQDENKVTVTDIVRVYAFDQNDLVTMRRATQVEALPEGWVGYFQEQLEKHARQRELR